MPYLLISPIKGILVKTQTQTSVNSVEISKGEERWGLGRSGYGGGNGDRKRVLR